MERQGETGKEQAFHMDSRQKQEESGMDNQQKQGRSLTTDRLLCRKTGIITEFIC